MEKHKIVVIGKNAFKKGTFKGIHKRMLVGVTSSREKKIVCRDHRVRRRIGPLAGKRLSPRN